MRSQTRGDMFRNGEAYERFMGRWSSLVAPKLVDFAEIEDGGHVLDVGSGTGALAFTIAERKRRARITGIDPSDGYVAYASSKNRYADRIEFQVGDAQSLRFNDGAFASALSLLVFNFIPDAGKALGELQRVVRREGRIAAAVWDYGGNMRMLRAFWDAAVRMDQSVERKDEKHMPLCRKGELARLWKAGGMANVTEQPLDIVMNFASFGDYWDPFLLGQGPAGAYARSLSADRLQALRDGVKQSLSVASEDHLLRLPARVWAVRGTVP